MEFNLSIDITVNIKNTQLKTIIKSFGGILSLLLTEFINNILLQSAEIYMNQTTKPICCKNCGNNKDFIWKTRHGKKTKLLTVFCMIFINQLQWKCKKCDHKFYITRLLLNVESGKTIPYETIKRLGLLGALASYRVSETILLLFGIKINKMAIWRSVQKIGKEITFALDPNELPEAEADGTGIPIKGIKKRGKEMKVIIQLKKTGGILIAGLSIGNYDQGWDKLFKPMIEVIKSFKEFVLVTDGDTSILQGLKNKINIIYQRCLWHIPHQLKYTLWKDQVKRKSKNWLHILTEIFTICSIRSFIEEDEIKDEIIKKKEKQLEELIDYCKTNNYNTSVSYLENAKSDMFTALKNRYYHVTTSRVERVMRTINLRINNRGKWSTNGSLNAVKIRLAHYYNGFNVE